MRNVPVIHLHVKLVNIIQVGILEYTGVHIVAHRRPEGEHTTRSPRGICFFENGDEVPYVFTLMMSVFLVVGDNA